MKLLGFERLVSGLGVDTTVGSASVGPSPRWHFPRRGRWGSPRAPRAERVRLIWERLAPERRTIGIVGLAVILGILVVAEWQSRVDAPTVTSSAHAVTRQTIDRLEAEQTSLKKQIASLRSDMAVLQQRAVADQSSASALSRHVATQRAIAGILPYEGHGVEILLDDSTARTLLPAEDPDNYIVHEYQIRDIVNLLWLSGATGIAVNDERFVNSTSVYCVGSTILINDTRTSPPYRIDAVGDVDRMQQAFDDGNSLKDLKGRVQAYGLVLQIAKVGSFTLPAFDGGIEMKHTTMAAGGVP